MADSRPPSCMWGKPWEITSPGTNVPGAIRGRARCPAIWMPPDEVKSFSMSGVYAPVSAPLPSPLYGL